MGAAAGAGRVRPGVKLQWSAPARGHRRRTHEAGPGALGGRLLNGVGLPEWPVIRGTIERRIDGGVLGETLWERVDSRFFGGFHRGIARPWVVSIDRASPIGRRERELLPRTGAQHQDRACDRNVCRQPEH
jgi:hypothetical protein